MPAESRRGGVPAAAIIVLAPVLYVVLLVLLAYADGRRSGPAHAGAGKGGGAANVTDSRGQHRGGRWAPRPRARNSS